MKQKINYIKKQEKSERFYFIWLAIVVGVINSVFKSNFWISSIFVVLECLILFYSILKKDFTKFLAYYLIFLSLSFESNAYFDNPTSEFYGFKNFQLFGVSINFIVLLLGAVALAFQKAEWHDMEVKTNKSTYWLIVFFFVSSIFFGALGLICNDNGILNLEGYLTEYFGLVYYGSFTVIMFFVCIRVLTGKTAIEIIKKAIVSIMIANVFVPYIAYICGARGGYGGLLLFPFSKFLLPFIILVPFYVQTKYPTIYVFLWIIGNIIPILFFSAGTGKEIVILFISIILFISTLIYRKKRNIWWVILVNLILLIVGFLCLGIIATTGTRFGDKANQLWSMLAFWRQDWLQSMPTSPQIRIYEFLSVFEEYHNKPWLILFGKGYLGSFVDYFGYFYSLPESVRLGAFSEIQWANGTFFRVHETLCRLWLANGLVGVFGFIYISISCLKKPNMWSFMGLIWFVFYMDTTITLSCIGICALVLSKITDKKKETIYERKRNQCLPVKFNMGDYRDNFKY